MFTARNMLHLQNSALDLSRFLFLLTVTDCQRQLCLNDGSVSGNLFPLVAIH